jgi:flagellar biosynthetic protein FliR
VSDALAPTTLLSVFAVFCRVGACLMVAPGFGATQVPSRIRLFIALAASLALSPMLLPSIEPSVGDGSLGTLVPLIFGELAVGMLFGFLARLFFLALQFITAVMTQAIGLSALPGTVMMDDDEQLPALSTLYTVIATTLMFVAGLHRELIRGLIDSYGTIPPGHAFDVRAALIDLADHAGQIFASALRIGSPFIVFSVVINFAIGITNKLTPNIPIFFIATPFIILAGLLLLLFTAQDFFAYFVASLGDWLNNG